jgi:septum formation protein
VLASASPRRRELLAGLGLAFEVRAAAIDESPLPGEAPAGYVRRLALAKAAAAAGEGELVLGADTVVVLDAQMLGKPRDPDEARRMLASIAGREHVVLTGVALLDASGDRQQAAVEASRVRMARMSPREIAWYVAGGEPLDKAGAYAVQGTGALFVEAVYGNYTNVVGLPLPATRRLFAALGYELRWFADGGAAAGRAEGADAGVSRRT